MRQIPVEFISADGHTNVHGYVWTSDNGSVRPRATVQIVHGMCEHIERYEDFARFLVTRGCVVFGHNQIGHGDSVRDASELGCLPPDGDRILVEDVSRMASCARDALIRQRIVPQGEPLPRFVLGHSMGSFVVRVFLAQHGAELAGAILSGTGHVAQSASRLGNGLARAVCAVRGPSARSSLLHALADGSYSKAIKGARTPFDWLSYNEDNVDAYIADDLCGFAFSAGGYATLTALTAQACSFDCAKQAPASLPVLIVSGVDDPVGGCGKGVRATYTLLRDAGMSDVEMLLYDGMRHEILNERERKRPYADIAGWIERHCEPPSASDANATSAQARAASANANADKAGSVSVSADEPGAASANADSGRQQ